jgi:hypothetical protein
MEYPRKTHFTQTLFCLRWRIDRALHESLPQRKVQPLNREDWRCLCTPSIFYLFGNFSHAITYPENNTSEIYSSHRTFLDSFYGSDGTYRQYHACSELLLPAWNAHEHVEPDYQYFRDGTSIFEMEHVREKECVFASAIILFFYHLVYTTSTRLGGYLIEAYSFGPTFYVAGSFYALAIILYYKFFKKEDQVKVEEKVQELSAA